MGHQVIIQPDGLLSVFSTGVDGFVYIDATDQELIEFYAEKSKQESIRHTTELIESLRAGKNPYYQFAISYEDALTTHIETFGDLADEEE